MAQPLPNPQPAHGGRRGEPQLRLRRSISDALWSSDADHVVVGPSPACALGSGPAHRRAAGWHPAHRPGADGLGAADAIPIGTDGKFAGTDARVDKPLVQVQLHRRWPGRYRHGDLRTSRFDATRRLLVHRRSKQPESRRVAVDSERQRPHDHLQRPGRRASRVRQGRKRPPRSLGELRRRPDTDDDHRHADANLGRQPGHAAGDANRGSRRGQREQRHHPDHEQWPVLRARSPPARRSGTASITATPARIPPSAFRLRRAPTTPI